VENVEIARELTEMADLLEIDGANPFRIRAYRNAVHTVEDHPTPLRTLVEDEADLTELPAIGKDIARWIEELVRTGAMTIKDELAERIPLTLLELMRLPGVGPRKARKLWEELDVETIDDLEAAAAAGDVQELEGFGKKTQDKILSAIERYRKRAGRFKLGDADQYVVPLLEHLRSDKAVTRVEVAGSYRRRLETVGDIDVLVISDDPAAVTERFVGYREVARTEMEGDTRSRVTLRSGLEVDLRILPPKSYGAALVYFTGSKDHNIKLRQRALDYGYRISEYGVFGEPEGERDEDEARDPWAGTWVAGREEKDVYAAVELPWIAPELRENRGEIEAAVKGELPDLIELDDMRGDLQMHSTWSDGQESIETMAAACAARGYEYMALTDHSQSLAMTGGLTPERAREQWEEIEEVREAHPEIALLRSMEVDILRDGALDMDDDVLEELDIVLISIHSLFELPPAEQTRRILRALRHPLVNILGHPTGRLINRRDAIDFDVAEVLACAAENEVALEINAHPDRLDLRDTLAMEAKRVGAKIVINTDAHKTGDLELMRCGVEQARRAWLEPDDVLNTLPLKKLLRALA
jgi:DNA polymerase (family 10)